MQVFLNREDCGVLEDGKLDEEGLSYIEGSGMWKRGEGTGRDWWSGIKTGREEEEAKDVIICLHRGKYEYRNVTKLKV